MLWKPTVLPASKESAQSVCDVLCEGWGRSFSVQACESEPLTHFDPCMILRTRGPGGPWVVGVSWI